MRPTDQDAMLSSIFGGFGLTWLVIIVAILVYLVGNGFGLVDTIFGVLTTLSIPILLTLVVHINRHMDRKFDDGCRDFDNKYEEGIRDYFRDLGGGNYELGLQIARCRKQLLDLYERESDIEARLTKVRKAKYALEGSMFGEMAPTYQRAEQILNTHLASRKEVTAEWEGYLNNLEALAAAHRAGDSLDGLPSLFHLVERLEVEEDKLARLTGELQSLQQIDAELKA